jgi:hypothetical protein
VKMRADPRFRSKLAHRCGARPQWAHPIPRCPPDR